MSVRRAELGDIAKTEGARDKPDQPVALEHRREGACNGMGRPGHDLRTPGAAFSLLGPKYLPPAIVAQRTNL
jgi:hypothetical protein